MTATNLTGTDSRRQVRRARLGELQQFARRFARNPLGMIGLVILGALLFAAVFAPGSFSGT